MKQLPTYDDYAYRARMRFTVIALLLVAAAVVGGVVLALMWIGPAWSLLLAAGLTLLYAPLELIRRRQRIAAEREEAGLCGRCGYDLRESYERCPECGGDIPEPLARRRRLRAGGAAAQQEAAVVAAARRRFMEH